MIVKRKPQEAAPGDNRYNFVEKKELVDEKGNIIQRPGICGTFMLDMFDG
jgi:hypothetical protein